MPSPEVPESTPASRAFVYFAAIILGTAFVVIFGIKLIADARTEAIKATDQSESNARVLAEIHDIQEVILAVTGCAEMTSDQCQERQREAGVQAIREVDCRTYRALRGEPPLGPGEACLPEQPAPSPD